MKNSGYHLNRIPAIGMILAALLILSITSCMKKDTLPKQIIHPSKDMSSWPKTKISAFSCILENEFNVKNRTFPCTLEEKKKSYDPCLDRETYFEGPLFPKSGVKEIHTLIQDITLFWERGSLQGLIINLEQLMPEEEIREIFELPEKKDYPDNIFSVSVRECSMTSTCIYIEGFEALDIDRLNCQKPSSK